MCIIFENSDSKVVRTHSRKNALFCRLKPAPDRCAYQQLHQERCEQGKSLAGRIVLYFKPYGSDACLGSGLSSHVANYMEGLLSETS